MATEQLISDIVSDKPEKQLDSLIGKLSDTQQGIENVIIVAKKLDGTLSSLKGVKSLSDQSKYQKEAAKDYEQLIKSVMNYEKVQQQRIKTQHESEKLNEREAKTSKELARAKEHEAKAELNTVKALREKNKELRELQKEQDRVAAQMKREEAALAKQQSAYAQLNEEYKKRVAKARDLATVYGVEDTMAKRAADSANKLADRLKAIDESVGIHTRKVGDYKTAYNGLGVSIQQVARELPNFAQNIQTGFLAISNNLPMLADQLKQARVQNELLKASGEKTVPVWKQVASSIFSWQTALVAVIALSVSHGKDIINWARGISEATLAAEKASKEYAAAIKEIEATSKATTAAELARHDALIKSATDVSKASDVRLKAANAIQKNWPQYYGVLSSEEIMQNRLGDAYRKTTDAIIKQALAKGAEEKLQLTAQQKGRADVDATAANKAFDDYLAGFEKVDKNVRSKVNSYFELLSVKRTSYWSMTMKQTRDLEALEGELFFDLGIDPTKLRKLQSQSEATTKVYLDAAARESEAKREYVKAFTEASVGDNAPVGSIAELEERVTLLREQERLSVIGSKEQLAITKERVQAEEDLKKAQQQGKYNPNSGGGRNAPHADEIAAEVAFTKEVYEQLQIRIGNQAEMQKVIYEDDTKSYQERLVAYINYLEKVEEARAIALYSEELQVKKQLEGIEALKEKKSKGGKLTTDELNDIAKERALQQQLLNIREEYAGLSLQTDKKLNEGVKRLGEDEANFRISQLNNISANLQSSYDEEVEKLQQTYRDKKITLEQYEIDELAIKEKYRKKAFDQVIEYLDEEIKILREAGIDTTKLEKAKNEALKAEKEKEFQVFKSTEEKKRAEAQKTQKQRVDEAAAYVNAVNDSAQATFGLAKDYHDRQTEKFEKRLTEIEKQRDAEIEMISTIGKTDQEVEKEKATIKGKYYQMEQEQMRNIAREKRRAAVAERVAALFSVAANTAVGIMKAFAELPLVAAIVAAAAIGVAGTAQNIAIASKPLPEYAEGTDNHPGGLAIVGDGGENELIKEPGKRPYWSPNKSTIIDLPAKSKVIPMSDIIGQHGALSPELIRYLTIQQGGADNSLLESIVSKGFEGLNNSIENIPQTSLIASGGEFRKVIKRGGNKTTYLNSYGLNRA